ncbi:MAG TPA: T9SS type A sorting domain-containing protein [Bacteroidales bacterium]
MRRRSLHVFIFFLILLGAFTSLMSPIYATNYYVAATGNDSNTGTSIGSPFLTVAYAVSKIVAGDSIYVRAGIYPVSATIKLSKSGTSISKYYLFVYPGDERPVLDFSSMAVSSSNRGIVLSGSYWYLKGIRIKGAGDNGINISGAYNTIEFCDFFENRDGGCQLGGGAHDNRIINCDSYYNADYGPGTTTNGGNADGFSPKLDVGTNNYFYGCRSWLNSDDGWDGYLSTGTPEVTTTLENCWTWKNGYLKDGVTTTTSMNGNGFKMGGNYQIHNFILKNCLSFMNKSKGFDQNHNLGSMTLYNCTGKSNGGNNFAISGDQLSAGKVLTVINGISYEKSKVSLLSNAVVATNSWDTQFTVTSADFTSIDTTGISAPRKADGSLPDVSFMHLANGSALIDAGTDVGLPYNGTKPDLGCFETSNSSVQYILTTGVASGSGTVSPSGSTKLYSSNSISVSATPAAGYTFDRWIDGSGATLSSSNPYTVSMGSGNQTVNAYFKSLPQYTLTTSISAGSGSISPVSGTQFTSGTTVTLTASPATNYTFISWGGDATGTSATATVVMNSDKNVTASFTLIKRTLTLVVNPAGSGTITPASGSVYDHGSNVKLTATPANGYIFDNWTNSQGTSLSTHDTLTITMDADKTITGNFKINTGITTINGSNDNIFETWSNTSGNITVAFYLETSSQVAIYLYNIQGTLVGSIPAKSYTPGNHQIDMAFAIQAPGIYLCKFIADGKAITQKFVLN